ARLDLYDFLLAGERTGDVRLADFDVIVVPPIGPVAAVTGEVKRPGIYELAQGTSVSELLELGGGFTPAALGEEIRLERFQGSERRVLRRIRVEDLASFAGGGEDVPLQDGDFLYVPAQRVERLPERRYTVYLEGNVTRPGSFPWE